MRADNRQLADLGFAEDDGVCPDGAPIDRVDYLSLIAATMAERAVSVRQLAMLTGIGRKRLACTLAAGGSDITFVELKAVLKALEIDFVQAVVGVEAVCDLDLIRDARSASLIAMVAELVRNLTPSAIEAIGDIPQADGTEVRPEWGAIFGQQLTERIVTEVHAINRRRDELRSF